MPLGCSKPSSTPKATSWRSLTVSGHLLINAEDHTERGLQAAGERARIHRVSTVLNLEDLDAENQMRRAAAFLGGPFRGRPRPLVPDARP
ncbi:MAG: hypothetical protein QOF70_6615 [Acetobacteraceae bacterium]|nr:hypothetical protein [Acetobacteraceae bacterium]